MKTNILKNLLMKAAMMAVCVVLFSCEKEEITFSTPHYPEVGVDKHYLDFKSGEETKTIKVSSSEEWAYDVDEDWVHATREGNKLTIQVDANRTKETRESQITIYALSDSNVKTNVIVSQITSLITVTCSETELNFSAYEGAFNTLSVRSNGDWKVKSTPDWLRASVSSGNGNKAISFKTLSANKTSSSRTGTVVIGSSDEEVSIAVMQYGEAMSNCQVTPKNITVLSNGIAFDMDYSRAGNVAHYYRGYMEASRVGSMTNPEIISTLQYEFQRHLPSDNEVAVFSDLKPNTCYVIYTLAYDIEGKRGELLSTEVKTCKEDTNEPCGWISNLGLGSSGDYWEWYITKSATCYSYWMMTTEDKDIALASDVLQAWWLEEAIRRNLVTEYFNGGDWQQRRGGNVIAVWTRGKTANGTWAGKISWKGCEVSSSAATRSQGTETLSPRTMTKQNATKDHSGHKLSPDQYQLYMVK